MNKKRIAIISIIILVFALFASFILNLLFKIHTNSIFAAEWSAGDALNYIASIFGAIGTITLGYVAYKQNDRLHELETNNYIANYSSMILVKKVDIKNNSSMQVNWNIHPEQIIVDKQYDEKTQLPVGYSFTFSAEYTGSSIPVLIHIRKCDVFCSDKKRENMTSCLFGENYSNLYSRVAIQKDKIAFGMTYVMDAKKRAHFEDAIKQKAYEVTVEVEFDIITDKNVVTKCKCRSYCRGNNSANQITWEDKNPMVFFYGHDIVKESEIKIAGEEEIENG